MQTGGTNTVASGLYIGSPPSGSAPSTYTLNGPGTLSGPINIEAHGTLSIQNGIVNTSSLLRASGGTFDWTAGALNITTNITWDPSADPSQSTSGLFGAALTLGNAQTLDVTGNETVGGTGGSQHDFALTVNTGATNTVMGTLAVNAGSQLNLNGGMITALAVNLGGAPAAPQLDHRHAGNQHEYEYNVGSCSQFHIDLRNLWRVANARQQSNT